MPTPSRGRWIVLLAAFFLAACGTAPPPSPPPSDKPEDPVATAPSQSAKEGTWFGDQAAAKAGTATASPPSPGAAPSSAPPLPRPNGPQIAATPVPERLPVPDDLLGLEASQVHDLLGTPDFRRRDPPAELWQYAGPGCLLDAFLYADSAGTLRVKHVEARSRSVTLVPPRDCYLGILAARKTPQGG